MHTYYMHKYVHTYIQVMKIIDADLKIVQIIHTNIHAYIQTNIQIIHTHIQIINHAYAHTYIHTYIHIIHTYIHTCRYSPVEIVSFMFRKESWNGEE